MRIGVPKEIKEHEYRVGLVPASAKELVHDGHVVLIEAGAGLGAGLSDQDYVAAGATIVRDADAVFGDAEMIVKVKEPLATGGRGGGRLAGGVPGVAQGDVTILGGGVAGSSAALMAIGMGANVTVIDRSLSVLRRIADRFGTAVNTVFSTRDAVDRLVTGADLVIGTVLIPGAKAPKLITADMVKRMRPGAVIVDVAIDQGGCSETSRPTTHTAPTYLVDGIVHYCVTNMPGAVARTSTFALNNATLPFVMAIAHKGWRQAMIDDPHLRAGLNVHDGTVTHGAVAAALGIATTPATTILGT